MTQGVRRSDGIEITFANGTTIACDGTADAAHTVVSHAHGDHLVENARQIIASELTAALTDVRQDHTSEVVTHPAIELVPAGHIAGSRAARLTDPETGRRYLYTGDCSPRDRLYLEGFDPPDADVLIIETTYGHPEYTFPPTDELIGEITDWFAETSDEVVVAFGYALGRAQKLQAILAETSRQVYVTDAIAELSATIEAHVDVSLPGQRYDADIDLAPGDVLVLPMQTTRLAWIEALVDRYDAVTAGFSGWAVDDAFVYRRGLDEGFVLSDHADFNELVEIVRAVDPERVYTTHGATEAFASHLTRAEGYETRALKAGQTTLEDF